MVKELPLRVIAHRCILGFLASTQDFFLLTTVIVALGSEIARLTIRLQSIDYD